MFLLMLSLLSSILRAETDRHPPIQGGCGGPGICRTTTGETYRRNTIFPELGDAWRDMNGNLIWGDTVMNEKGSPRFFDRQAEASAYCDSIGAELPTQGDFERLRESMGWSPDTPDGGYTPQVLPNLRFVDARGSSHPLYFWTASTHAQDERFAPTFVGTWGHFLFSFKVPNSFGAGSGKAARCVVRTGR